MTEIRTKDKLFLAVVVPVAVIAAYWYGWRASASRRLAELETSHAQLVAVEDFPMEKRRAERELAEANAELEAEKKISPPQTKVSADAQASAAERERQVLQLLREAGLTVVGSTESKDGASSSGPRTARGGELLKATGLRNVPVHRAYTVDGRYPDVVKALKAIDDRKMAAIPDRVLMRASGRNRWTLEIWL